MHGLAKTDGRLLAVLERDFERAARAAGDWLVCRPGCGDCCHGPFPITRLDVWRLRAGLERLREQDPATAARVSQRAREAVGELTAGYPGEARTGRLPEDEEVLDRFFERHAGLACPALDPRTGRCELYAFRPVACRTYGPPLRFGPRAAPACPLCFRGADEAEVERCRIEPDEEGLEQTILARLGAVESWETLVAFALAP